MPKITKIDTHDVRFPTSRDADGSDAMHEAPDYSAAYCVLRTDAGDGLEGHGLTFTCGRGTELCVAAIHSLAPLLTGVSLDDIVADTPGVWRRLTGDSQLRWLGPDKGIMHLSTAALMNAVWDLRAKIEKMPLWLLLARMPPRELAKLSSWHYLGDVLDEGEAREMYEEHAGSREDRISELHEHGYPAYTTSAGWLGYSDEKVRRLVREARSKGWTHFKMKVGRDIIDDRRRAALLREEIGGSCKLMMDANQVWNVRQAIENIGILAEFDPHWMEEPTHPDDILGYAKIAKAVAPVKLAGGEHFHNALMFKQFLESGSIAFCQIDSCRLSGVNEILPVLLIAKKFGVPVCPHAGGVGLCEYVRHLAMFDYVAVSASLDNRLLEYVDHLHGHFVDPARVVNGRYAAPSIPGYSGEMDARSVAEHEFPGGEVWRAMENQRQ